MASIADSGHLFRPFLDDVVLLVPLTPAVSLWGALTLHNGLYVPHIADPPQGILTTLSQSPDIAIAADRSRKSVRRQPYTMNGIIKGTVILVLITRFFG
jgi:hypothetical protein